MLSTIKKGIRILEEDGLFQFIKRFFVFLSHNSFSYRTYYLYEKPLIEIYERNITPKTSVFTLKIIRATSEVDQLIENGFNFGYFQDIYSIKELLSKGAVLFCVFVKEDWAHSSWLAMDNNSIVDPFFNPLPLINAGCIGLCATNPAYRGLGLYPFVLAQICDFLKENGKSIALISTAKKNVPSISGIKKAGFSISSEAYHLNIGFWTLWRKKHQKV
jgi:hypothetical protein